MDVPFYIKQVLEEELKNVKLSKILQAREILTQKYKHGKKEKVSVLDENSPEYISPEENRWDIDIESISEDKKPGKSEYISSEEERLAYLISRLPATYSVIQSILTELKNVHNPKINTLLDIGSGPGTVAFAFTDVFEDLQEITLVEKDKYFIQHGRKFMFASGNNVMKNAKWNNTDLNKIENIKPHEMVTASYVINELEKSDAEKLIKTLWKKTEKYILIVEPGTPAGFSNIKFIRNKLISMGAFIISPCPHNNDCPILENDWCHFSQRIERSKYQRFIKEGIESYEDEKYSYILASKSKSDISQSRVIRHPQIHKGFIELKVCTDEGIKDITMSKKMGEKYKQARKTKWGEPFIN